MTEDPRSREHIKSVWLATPLYIAVQKLSGDLRISQKAAILLAISEGVHSLGLLEEEDYQLLCQRYKRPLEDIVAEKRIKLESSHSPVLATEKQKAIKVRKRADYDLMTLEQLQGEYAKAISRNDIVEPNLILFSAKKRGIKLRNKAI